jgi:hypothetical protein
MICFAWRAETPATLTGPVNPRTGKRSHAGTLSAFVSRKERAAFIERTNGSAVEVTRPYARQMKAGLDERAFNQLVAVLVGGDL